MLQFMFITNRPEVALAAEAAGVDRIFIDMEYIGKAERQGGLDTVQNHHTPEDVRVLRRVLTHSALQVRINPIYEGSAEEIEAVISAGADILMLPYFRTVEEVRTFIRLVDGRARTLLLFETPESVEQVEEILKIPGIDECLVGLNDLHLGYHRKFMFELLADGTVEKLCRSFREAGKLYGFGGIARLHEGMLPAEMILSEHVRLGSGLVILSRGFCNTKQITDLNEIQRIMREGAAAIRQEEAKLHSITENELEENRQLLVSRVKTITENMA